jgi:dTDP-glucose 4,6-dehydratase
MGEVYNLGGGEETTNREITRLVLEHTGADEALVRHVADRPGHDHRYSLDTTKARDELGWEPELRLADGFPRTAAWYRDNRAWWEPIKHSGGYREYYDKQYAARLGAS